ncbi:hypothetical protein CEXT_710751 [Caerostris extrusa]|uniref:Uncharacterized protein n=1 Tax=Caerostris extrusa TaxID=172846 RepID=A0AAV4NW65_CAEEX|nr:hypothetical protein CEXT_710751 [Caerostris extrusa]
MNFQERGQRQHLMSPYTPQSYLGHKTNCLFRKEKKIIPFTRRAVSSLFTFPIFSTQKSETDNCDQIMAGFLFRIKEERPTITGKRERER